ncbi:MAG: tetratricopeptide repeat protein [Limisphaerales bacterium]
MSNNPAPETPRRGPARDKSPPAARVRLSVGKRILFSLVAVVLCLASLEGVLALLGIRPASYEKDPYVGFSSYLPLFVEKTGPHGEELMATANNKLRLFNAQEFPKRKAPGVCRIFSVGESTTYGAPFVDPTSYTGWLRQFLKALAPDRRWEVINAGGTSYASYRVARLMEELIRYQPDLFVIYSGHNEFLEHRTYGKIQELPQAVLGLGSLVSRSRLATVAKTAVEQLSHRQEKAKAQPSVLAGEVDTLLDHTVGPSAYTRDDRLRDQILEHYRFNLARMVDVARSVGAKVILITTASNLRDESPFKSEHRADVKADDLRRWQELYAAGRRNMGQGLYQKALAAFDEAAKIDDRYAELQFLRGGALEQLGRYPEAKLAYERARDEDVCPLRALGPERGIVQAVAAERHVPCIDFVAMQEERAEHGITGKEGFYDHVHPTIERHSLLALEILRTMEREKLVKPNWNEAVIQQVAKNIYGKIDAKAQSQALMSLSKVLGWAGKLQEAYQLAVRAVQTSPNIAEVQYQAGLCAQLLNRNDEAIEHYRRTIEIAPTAALAHGNLGVALEDKGELREAIKHFLLAIQYGNPDDVARNQRNLARVRQRLEKSGR